MLLNPYRFGYGFSYPLNADQNYQSQIYITENNCKKMVLTQ